MRPIICVYNFNNIHAHFINLALTFIYLLLQKLSVTLEERDAEELVLVLQGYYALLAEKSLPVHHSRDNYGADQGEKFTLVSILYSRRNNIA